MEMLDILNTLSADHKQYFQIILEIHTYIHTFSNHTGDTYIHTYIHTYIFKSYWRYIHI